MEAKQENKITKESYREYLDSLYRDITGAEDLSKKAIESIQYLVKNYMNLTDEMQEFTDKLVESCIEPFNAALKIAPDDQGVRKAKRILRTLKHKLPSAMGLLSIIESRANIENPILKETRSLFEKYFQEFIYVLYDIVHEESHKGQASFAKLSMLFSTVDEFIVGFHLAQHGFINQSYTHTRTIFESIAKLELFIRDESYAILWSSNDEKRKKKELKPAAVRDKLGVKEDPLYSFFSAHGPHVTFEYMQSKTAKKIGDPEKPNPQIIIFLGGTKIEAHILMANAGCIMALFMAFAYVGKAFPDRVHDMDYPQMIEDFFKAFIDYLKIYAGFYKSAGVDVEEIEAFLKNPLF